MKIGNFRIYVHNILGCLLKAVKQGLKFMAYQDVRPLEQVCNEETSETLSYLDLDSSNLHFGINQYLEQTVYYLVIQI